MVYHVDTTNTTPTHIINLIHSGQLLEYIHRTNTQQCSSCGFVVAVSHCDYCGVKLDD